MAERQKFSITDVSGGMNADQHPLYIAENEAADILNFRIDRVGSLVGRQGVNQWEADAPNVILALGRWLGGDPRQHARVLMVCADGKMYARNPNDPNDSFTEVYSGLDTSAQGMFLPAEDLLLYANGKDDIVAYDGTVAMKMGIDAPASATVAATTGTLTGAFRYAVSFVSVAKGWESPALAATPNPITLSGQGATVTWPSISGTLIDEVHIYRTTAGGANYMFLGIAAANTTTFTDDGSASPSPINTPVLTTDVITPGEDRNLRAENIAYHTGRLWASVGDEVYWSKPYQMNLFPYFTNTTVPFEGNDTVTALKSFQDYLLIFGGQNTVLVAGDGGTSGLDIQFVRQDTNLGAPSRHAMVEVDNQLVFLTNWGMHVFPGFGEFAPKLTRTVCDSTVGCRLDASMVYVPEERAVWLSLTDKTWVIHLANQGITKYDFYMRKPLTGGLNSLGLPLWVNAEWAAQAPSEGTHLNLYGGTADEGDDIVALYKSRIWTLGAADMYKYWRRIGAFAQTGGDLQVTVECPDTLRSFTVSMVSGDAQQQSTWGSGVWDTSLWSFEGLSYFISALPSHELYGRSMQIEMVSTSDEGIELHTPITMQLRLADRFLGR